MIDDVHVNKIMVSDKVRFSEKGFKYFIGYKYDKKVTPLWIILPKISTYRRDFGKILKS